MAFRSRRDLMFGKWNEKRDILMVSNAQRPGIVILFNCCSKVKQKRNEIYEYNESCNVWYGSTWSSDVVPFCSQENDK